MNVNDIVVQQSKSSINKRGRPKKTMNTPPKKTPTPETIEALLEEDIILHIPIFIRDLGNSFKETTTCLQTEYHNSDNETVSTSYESDSDKSKGQLHQVICEKDKLIKELQDKLIECSKCSVTDKKIEKIDVYSYDSPFEKNEDGSIKIPEETHLACMFDTCEINNTPIFVPDKYYDGKYYTSSWFCSLSCAVAYLIQLNDPTSLEKYHLLKQMYGIYDSNIEPSPHYKLLNKYGGKLTIEEYRNGLNKFDKSYRILQNPIMTIPYTIEENTYAQTIMDKKTKSITSMLKLKKK